MAGCNKLRGKSNPKFKSNRSAIKRVSVTSSGLIKKPSKGKSHCLSSKNRKHKRRLLKAGHMSKHDSARIRRFIPYLF